MANSVKLKNNIFLDSSSVNYKKNDLKTVLDGVEFQVSSYLKNGWSSNGRSYMMKIGEVKILQFGIRNGTTNVITDTLPDEMKPVENLIVQASDYSRVGYAIIYKTGKIEISSNIFTPNTGSLLFNAIYI